MGEEGEPEPRRRAGAPVLEPAAARVMVAWRSSPRRTPDATMPGWSAATSSLTRRARAGGEGRGEGHDEEGARDGVGEGWR